MHKAMDEYVKLCAKAGASAEKLVFEADSIENGIITHISQKKIGRLSMGAAADALKMIMIRQLIWLKN
ncbi:hypothetical protein V2J09_004405 [Rumex salicifolius]